MSSATHTAFDQPPRDSARTAMIGRFLDVPDAEIEPVAKLLRDDDVVMSPQTARSAMMTAVSFTEQLCDRIDAEHWSVDPVAVDVDADGVGEVILRVDAGAETYTFGAFSHAPTSGPRAGRIRENTFDFFGVLATGAPDVALLRRDHEEFLAHAWGGRSDSRVLGWTVANRSNRSFEYAISALAAGTQPDGETLDSNGGYLIRNAGYYGNGRHGTMSVARLSDHSFSTPYSIDLFSLYLWKRACAEIVQTAAERRSPTGATRLDASRRAHLGVGNSSGIGTVAALVRWPLWLSAFLSGREALLAYSRSRTVAEGAAAGAVRVREQLHRKANDLRRRADDGVAPEARQEIFDSAHAHLDSLVEGKLPDEAAPFDDIYLRAAASADVAAREAVAAALVGAFPEQVRCAGNAMAQQFDLVRMARPWQDVGRLKKTLAEKYAWALAVDFSDPDQRTHAWYRSEENGENRRGERGVDADAAKATYVEVAQSAAALHADLAGVDDATTVGEFLLHHPEHALMASRVCVADAFPYSECHDNLISRDFRPADYINLFLAVLGIEGARPVSNQWVQGTFFAGVPDGQIPGGAALGEKEVR